MNKNKPSPNLILWIFGALFLILGLGYSELTPIFENSDETLHYPYIKHLTAAQGLPLAIPNQLWHQEGTQPPFYYVLVAATTFRIDTDNLTQHLQPNPHWRFADVRPLLNDNQNVVLHGPSDDFPYQQAALAIHIGRWWSLLFGLVTVVCTYLITRQLFPSSLPLAITATALTALTPQFIRVSATVSNDSLSAALASFTVFLALKFTQFPPSSPFPVPLPVPKNRHALILGLLSALALLTKLSSLSVFFLAAFITFWRNFFITEIHHQAGQKMVRWLLIMAGMMFALTGWWFLRNYQLYGEWLAIETHLDLAGRGQLTGGQVWALRAEIGRAYWATFGWGQIRPPEWIYRTLSWFTLIGLISLGLAFSTKLIKGSRSRPIPLNLALMDFETIIFLLFWAGLNLVLYVRWVMVVGSVSHTRLIFPAITAISLLLALGWLALLPTRLHLGFAAMLTVGLLSLNIYSLGWLIYPAFTPAGNLAQTPAANLANRQELEVTFLNSLHLKGGRVYPLTGDTLQAGQGDEIIIEAQWQTISAPDKNYSVAATLLAPDGTVLAQRETYPGLGLRPTAYLTPPDSFIDHYPLALSRDVTAPLLARAVITLFDFDSATRAGLPALDNTGHEVTPIVGYIKIVPQSWPHYQPENRTSVTFANAIELIGYDLTDQSQNLTLYWRSLAPVNEDYNLFIHLLDEAGNIVAQADAPLTHKRYPTRWWIPGETITADHPLPQTPTATRLRLGLYSLTNDQRLLISESDLPAQDNNIEIGLVD